jgi:hypothetical protein
VIVNRVWQYHFGRGLVGTSSDFGQLGDRPSHPELLDWLALRFVGSGWQLKDLHRLILLSATYRQTALRTTPRVAQHRDPDNHWLWRANIRRLDAEPIRDAMLAVGGELDGSMGGPSVETSVTRRTIYTRVIRNSPDVLLRALDAPDGFVSTAQRDQSTTPAQALMLINGDWSFQRARALAARVDREAAADGPAPAIVRAYLLCFARRPEPLELTRALAFLQQMVNPQQPSLTDSFASTDSRMRALTELCHVLLNTNEFIYVD